MTDSRTSELETDPLTPVEGREEPRASDWLWRPWYAKLWWTAIPVYWLGAAASLKVAALAQFYETALAGYLNVLFYPLVALMVLGIGYLREWMGPIDWSVREPYYRRRTPNAFRDPTDRLNGRYFRD
jgi:hypothetical protein